MFNLAKAKMIALPKYKSGINFRDKYNSEVSLMKLYPLMDMFIKSTPDIGYLMIEILFPTCENCAVAFEKDDELYTMTRDEKPECNKTLLRASQSDYRR